MKRTINILKRISLYILTFVLIVIAFGSFVTFDNNKNPNKVTLSADTWNSELVEIEDMTSTNVNNYIDIFNFVNTDADGLVTSVKNINQITAETIIRINDGLDLYYFAELCNPFFANGTTNANYKTFLQAHYQLENNINYENASMTFKMLRPIGWSDAPFSGIFDGTGHTISNIFYRPFEDEAEAGQYVGMAHVALFSENAGTIKNVGIVDANMIQYDLFEGFFSVTPFIGENLSGGLVENCFVQDLRGNDAGFSAEGGYHTMMFAAINNGTMRNCYVAVDRITSPTISSTSMTTRHPFIYENKGTLEYCYYDAEILTNTTTYTQTEYNGLTALKTAEFLDLNKFLHYDPVTNDQIWYSNGTYRSEYSSYLKLKYPVLRGFEVTTINDVEYFMIENINDLVLMSEYVDKYQAFRTASYVLTNSVDLNTVSPNAYIFTDAVFSGKLIGAAQGNDGYSVRLADGSISDNPAIINLKIDKGNSYNGYRCYGFFSVLAGTVEGIDFVNVTINQNDITTVNLAEINTVGVVCGLLEGGSINDVNVDVDITLTNTNNNQSVFLGSQNVGGICGTATKGKISNSTTTGIINHVNYTNVPTGNYSHSIGGILGKAENNDGVINCLNNIEINNISYTNNPNNYKQYLGGVIGSGHINNTYQLQNNTTINVDNGTYYSLTYVGGVIGLVTNASSSNGIYLNNANINFDVDDNNYKAYISGVMNVISETALQYDAYNITLTPSDARAKLNAQNPFEFTSLSNAGLLNITNSLSASKYPAKYSVFTTVTEGIDIRAAGICYSYLTNMNVLGAYNLNQHYERENGTIKKIDNDAQSVDISMMDEYAPAFNADNKAVYLNGELHLDTNYLHSNSTTLSTAVVFAANSPILSTTINLERVYNYQETHYITNKPVYAYTLQLSGCINGRNFNLKNIRNDGDLKVYFTQNTGTVSLNQYYNYFGDYKKLKVYGVMEEVSLEHRAEDIYNGGNISVSSDTSFGTEGTADKIVNFNLYIAGICYKNVGNDDSGDSLMIERGYVGSLHNTVNNGEIRITNGNNLTGNPTAEGHFYGVSRVGGICAFNCSTISQTFNLGNIYNINYIQSVSNYTGGNYSANFEVETGGFCFGMQNEVYDNNGNYTHANIIDSANNGTVVSMTTRNANVTWVNAGGFVGRNDRCEDGDTVDNTDTSKNPHEQKIQYSINYGDIYSYSAYNENSSSGGEPQGKAAGFICLGACTIVDVINYGNVYCTKISGGMYGIVFFDRMRNAGASQNSPIYIANAINYGKIDLLNRNDTNINLMYNASNGMTGLSINSVHTTPENSTHYPVGALIGMIRSNNSANDLYALNIKNLVNFYDSVDIVGRTYNMDTMNSDNTEINAKIQTLQYMATTKANDYSPAPFNTERSGQYRYGIKSYHKDNRAGITTTTNLYSQDYNGGIFNENYTLRTAPAFTYDAQGNIDQNNTDNFIADYIQFVPYSKVNEYLIEKIGLKDVVESNAYNNALTNVELIKQVLIAKNKNLGEIEDVYNQLLANNRTIVESDRYDIADAIKSYLDTNPEKASEIAKILVDDTAAVQQIISATDIQTIITKVINNLTAAELDQYLIQIINNYGLDEFINDTSNADFVTNFIDSYANQANIQDNEKTLIVDLFNLLVANDACLEQYINSLTDAEKAALSNNVFTIVENNSTVMNAIADTYFEQITVQNVNEFNTLKEAIITDKIAGTSTQYPITDAEYIAMYNNIYYESYTDAQVRTAIQNANLATLINTIRAQATTNTTNDLYKFLESGRINSTGIYLPVSAVNYVAIIDTRYKSYIGETGTTGNNQAYTGNITNINGTAPGNNLFELYITRNNLDSLARYNNRYYYWSGNNDNNITTLTFTRSGRNNNPTSPYYGVGWRQGQNTSSNSVWPNTVTGTGVYATGTNATQGFYSDYDFSNITYYTYIDYAGNVTAKNNGNVTNEMLNQMYDLASGTNETYIEDYLYNIYLNSTESKIEFLKLLFPSSNVGINEALEYLDTNLSTSNVNAAIKAITDKTAQANIVKLLNNNGNGYVEILPTMLKVLGDVNNYDQIKSIIGDVYYEGYDAYTGSTTNVETVITNMVYSNNQIWDGLTDAQKREIINYYSLNTNFGATLITDAVNNNKLTNTEYKNLVNQLIIADSYNLYTYRNNLNQHLSENLMAEISAIIISNSTSLFNTYTGLTQSNIIEQLENLGVDPSVVTDFTGIYALASSMGIEAGLFLPDNISLIELDIYTTDENGVLKNDSSWRGGTDDNPNGYTVGERSVNYKVYYEMKQLKKSIATIIFMMELTDEAGENVIDNNIEYDYKCNYKEKDNAGNPIVDANGNHIITNEVRFYIPINHDILKKNYLVANMKNGSYELSYGASFDEDTNKLEIEIPNNLAVGDVLEDTFVIQAEDTNVKTTYTMYVTITNPAYLDPLTSVVVDGVNSNLLRSTDTGDRQEVITNAVVTTAVLGYNGRIVLNYGTINMINGLDLLNNVKLYKAGVTTLPAAAVTDFTTYMTTELTNGKDYHFNDVTNNGKVVINNVTGTGFNNNSYPAGTVFFDISIDNMQTKGIYLIEIEINEGAKYYVLFEKAASNNSSLESLTYDDEVFNNDLNNPTNSNIGSIHTHKFGTPLTADDLSNASYLKEIVVAPHATYQVTNVSCSTVDGKIQYQVEFTITAESGTTSTFTHYITEEDYVTYINRVYLDGGIIEDEPLGDDENITEGSYIFEAEFEKTEAPSYRFEYQLSSFYTNETSQYFKVQFFDENGAEIDTPSGVNITVTEGLDFEIEFSSDAASVDYYFAMVYEHSVDFNATTKNTWEVKFDTIHIEKFKSRNSYLDNITFFSESVTASIRTMIDVDEISLDSYEKMLSDPTRKIVCLPGQIYYNEYAYDVNKQEDFYVIGLVNKTALDYYTPDFVLPDGAKVYRTETNAGGVVFRYMPFYVDDLQSLTTFLVSEDGSQIMTEDGTVIAATFTDNQIAHDGKTYTLSPVAGLPSVEYNGVVIENTTLRTDYNTLGTFNEEAQKFLFVNYRVYAEIYDDLTTDEEKRAHITDYKIAAQDLTNNIRFNIIIDTDTNCDISTKLYNIYLEFICNALPEGKDDLRENYEFYNKAGMFAYFENGTNVLSHESLKSNTSGYYEISVLLLEGYSATFTVTDGGKITNYENGDEFYIAPSITARTIELHITIHNASDVEDDWGVHVKDESFAK